MNNTNNKQLKYEKALEYEIFEKREYNFAKNKIQDAKCIFDIGGHIGLFSKRCRNLNPNTKIHYFEPVEELYNKAKFTFKNDKNIVLNNNGINSESKEGTILLNEEKTMQSSKYLSFLNPRGKEIQVKFITLEEYIIKNNIDKINVLKMDIEGMEFEVITSRGDFERKKIQNLIIEFHLLNEKMKSEWIQIFQKIKNIFSNVEIIKGGYREEVFLLRANKNSGL